MTALPVKNPIQADQVYLLVEQVRERCTMVRLTAGEYCAVIEQAASHGFTSGRIYDALLLRCAAKIKADVIYRLNLRHFRAIDPTLASRMRAP